MTEQEQESYQKGLEFDLGKGVDTHTYRHTPPGRTRRKTDVVPTTDGGRDALAATDQLQGLAQPRYCTIPDRAGHSAEALDQLAAAGAQRNHQPGPAVAN